MRTNKRTSCERRERTNERRELNWTELNWTELNVRWIPKKKCAWSRSLSFFLVRWSVICCQDSCFMVSPKSHSQKSISVAILTSTVESQVDLSPTCGGRKLGKGRKKEKTWTNHCLHAHKRWKLTCNNRCRKLISVRLATAANRKKINKMGKWKMKKFPKFGRDHVAGGSSGLTPLRRRAPVGGHHCSLGAMFLGS